MSGDERLEPPGVPPALRRAIEADLHPVTALPPPGRRAFGIVPVAGLLLVAATVVFGLRIDAPRLGPFLTWGVSAGQVVLGIALAAAALREAVPGTLLPRGAITAAFIAAGIAVLGITWSTWAVSPTMIGSQEFARVWRICLAGTMVTALPALAVIVRMIVRAFPLRPGVAGAIGGLGAGLMADAGWRLFCDVSDPSHVLGAHTLAVVGMCLAGAAAARARRW